MPSGRAYALAVAVALAASASSLANGFVFDDVRVIEQDPRIRSLRGVPALLGEPYWSRDYANSAYRPATSISFALDWSIAGARPAVFHATNVVLHVLVVALVLALASRVLSAGGAVVAVPGRDRADGATDAGVGRAASAGAVVAALWFAVQPVHVEAVANVVGRAELLAAAAYLAAVLAWWKDGDLAADVPRRGGLRGLLPLAVLAAAAVAFGAKEHALTLPAVLLLTDVWAARGRGEAPRVRVRRHALLFCGVCAVAVGVLAARAHAVGGAFATGVAAPGLEGASAWGRALVMAPAVLVWLRWMIVPVHLSADYLPNAFVPRPELGVSQIAGAAAFAGLLLVGVLARRRAPGAAAGVVWAIVTASVAANVVFPTGVILGERLAYLPSVGFALAAGALWELLPRRGLTWALTATVLAALAARTLARIPVWHDQGRFLASLAADAPDSYRTHWGLGAEAFKRGAFAAGEREMLAAIRINPADAALVQELGERYLETGLFAPAARYLSAAYRLDTIRSEAAVRAAFAYLKGARPDSAAAIGTEALRRAPDAPALLIVTREALLALARPREALALARRLVYLAPGVWWYQRDAGYSAAVNGRCDEARARLERAAALAPSERGPAAMLRRLGRGRDCGLGRGPA